MWTRPRNLCPLLCLSTQLSNQIQCRQRLRKTQHMFIRQSTRSRHILLRIRINTRNSHQHTRLDLKYLRLGHCQLRILTRRRHYYQLITTRNSTYWCTLLWRLLSVEHLVHLARRVIGRDVTVVH